MYRPTDAKISTGCKNLAGSSRDEKEALGETERCFSLFSVIIGLFVASFIPFGGALERVSLSSAVVDSTSTGPEKKDRSLSTR